jgi:Mlc titration factor MtfA (ptsG expression regulator)
MSPMTVAILLLASMLIVFFLFRKKWFDKPWKKPGNPFPGDWRIILLDKVPFYRSLDEEERQQFEYKVQEFLLNCRITGISTAVDTTDRLLVAASAVIPVFNLREWKYINLYEVLLYPDRFNRHFEVTGPDRNILGMVGTGYMEGKMILSKQALHQGFRNETDKKNTAIHEFVHLIDKSDGAVDGIPEVIMQKQYVLPWIDMIGRNIEEIRTGASDINSYGATNKAEFLAVAGEYFFERPQLLSAKHPDLYETLAAVFNQDMSVRMKNKKRFAIGRNDPCPCGSGRKFKKCCGRK